MLRITIWDVQHGSAVHMRTPNRLDIVQDLGTGTYRGGYTNFSPFKYLKEYMNVAYIDGVIITHPHRDHLDDIYNFDYLKPRVLYRPRQLSDDEVISANRAQDRGVIDKYLEINRRYIEQVVNDPFQKENNGDVDIKIFTPKGCSHSNINNHSLVTVVTYARSRILLPGDNEPESWQELLEDAGFRSAIAGTDILLAAHHGRDSGFYNDIFSYFTPKLVAISDGRYCDTSATERYSRIASGWTIHRRSGSDVERKCVTTRNDGNIIIDLGINTSDSRPFLSVTVD